MHRLVKRLLENATGFSEFAITAMIDIRDFSSFANREESTAVAEFIKRFYTTTVDRYFPDARFFKPTGDGLLVIVPYTDQTLRKVATQTVRAALKLLAHFGSICADDPMINFEVPDKIGISMSRGTVCGLISGRRLLDYSGRPLNLASRLLDLARPSGIVFDDGFGITLLPDDVAKQFARESVYIRGVADRKPIGICYTKGCTTIPARAKQPLTDINWRTVDYTYTLRQIKKISGPFVSPLPTKPTDASQITVRLRYPAVRGSSVLKGAESTPNFDAFQYMLDAGQPTLVLDFGTLAQSLVSHKVKDTWKVVISIRYPEA